jgi:hypothetical protein
MKPCVVGIGGAGGNILKQFLQNMDVGLLGGFSFGDISTYGDVKGIWLDSASQDALGQTFYGNLVENRYPSYLICHERISDKSLTRGLVMNKYGFDLKAPGFDRRAEYLKGIFEVFESDPDLKDLCLKEFKEIENPLAGYMWKVGIKPFTIIAVGKSNRKETAGGAKVKIEKTTSVLSRLQLSINQLPALFPQGAEKVSESSMLCDSILFLASLGGGTGTGFINPITKFVRSEESIFPIFTLGILTERGSDKRHAKEEQRYLGATIAMYDLLTKESGKGIDGIILIDNQIIKDRFAGDYLAMDSHIFGALKPLLDPRNYPGDKLQDDAPAIRRVFWEVENEAAPESEELSQSEIRLLPPLLVPCYYTQPDYVGDIDTLVEGALGGSKNISDLGKDGRLFPCDPAKAERVLVFTRGFFSVGDLMDSIKHATGLPESKIKIYRKLGDSVNEDILILLRNPYGGTPDEHKCLGTLEWKLHEMISGALKFIEDERINILGFQSYTDLTKKKLDDYFYGENGLRDELHKCLKRLENGDKPIFTRPLRIFGEDNSAASTYETSRFKTDINNIEKEEMEDLARAVLEEILGSDECREIIKKSIKS